VTGWSGRRVLVTGAGGFIGSHLCERLVELGASVRAFAEYNSLGSWGWLDESPRRGELEVMLGDVRDTDSVAAAAVGIDTIFHLAALIAIPFSYEAPLAYLQTNAVGTANVLRAAQRAGCRRVVHTSTSEVYGTARYVPIDEKHPLQAQSPYAASKIAADKLAESFHLSYGVPVSTLRPFNTYGPRQSARAVIPTIVTQAIAGEAVILGNVTPTRDFTYVTDTVEAFVLAADCDAALGRAVNVGSGREISIAALADRIEELVDRRVPVERDPERVRPAESEVERLAADASLAHELFGWTPAVGLDEGLRATAGWIGENLARYRVGVYTV
jgi:NAD dependent epimerase/dehydratase